jgi:hypothetical protein
MNKQTLITDYITLWSRLLLEKLMLTKLVKKPYNTAVHTSLCSSWYFSLDFLPSMIQQFYN